MQAVMAARRDDQHAETPITTILARIIKTDLSLPAIYVLLRANSFGPVVQLHVKAERPIIARHEFKRRVGEEAFGADMESQRVLPCEAHQFHSGFVRSNDSVHDKISKAARVVLMGDADFGEVSTCGRLGFLAVEDAIPQQRQLIIGRCSATAGGGVPPPTHPASATEHPQAFLHATFAVKRLLEGPADLHQLLDSQW